MNFEQFSLDRRIVAQIKAVGYTTPTPIQQQAIPVVLEGRDVMGIAQTGTGKTAAFMLPILQRLTKGPLRRVRALIVAPTRELAEQIYQMSLDFSKNTKVRSIAVYGGVSKFAQVSGLRRGVEIVIACPGRLLDLVNDRAIDLSQVEVLVLDEADRITPIQQQAIPMVLEGRDVMGLAQTGTGKTAVFLLPILQRLSKGPLRRVRAFA